MENEQDVNKLTDIFLIFTRMQKYQDKFIKSKIIKIKILFFWIVIIRIFIYFKEVVLKLKVMNKNK